MTAFVEPEGPWFRVVARRAGVVPWLLVPAGLVVTAAGASVVARVSGNPRSEMAGLALWAWATITALVASLVLKRRFHVVPGVPGDDASPIRVRWTWGGVAAGAGPAETLAHVLPDTLRLAAGEWLGRDVAAMLAGAALGMLGGGCAGFAAIPVLAWALGFPRSRRVGLDVPWDDLSRVLAYPTGRFLVWRAGGDRVSIELEAKFSHGERLAAAFRERLGHRFDACREPAHPDLLVHDEDAGVADVLLHRVRAHPWLGVAASAWVAAFVCGTAVVAGVREAAAAAGVLSVAALVLAFLVRDATTTSASAGMPRAPDDASFPYSVRWTNRRGFPGPRNAEAHVLPLSLRVVAYEWETWDALVVAAAVVAGALAGPCLGAVGAYVLATAFGLPRRRRIAVDLLWSDVTRVDVRGSRIDVRTRLSEPADHVELDSAFAYRDGLVNDLHGRLRARVFVAQHEGRGTDVRRP